MAEIKSLGNLGDEVRPVGMVGLGAAKPTGVSEMFGLGSAFEQEKPSQPAQVVCPPGCAPIVSYPQVAQPQPQQQVWGLQRVPTSGSPLEDIPGVPAKDSLLERDVGELGEQLEEAAEKVDKWVKAGKGAVEKIKEARSKKQARQVLAEAGVDVVREPSVFEKIKLRVAPKTQPLMEQESEKRKQQIRELGIEVI